MDVDAFVNAHRGEWARLDTLARRADRGVGRAPGRRGLSGAEVDELVELYQRTATHLSMVRSRTPDAQLIARLSTLTAHGRAAVTGARQPAWRSVSRFFRVTFPAAAYSSAPWWVATALVNIAIMVALGVWTTTHPHVLASLLPPAQIRQLVNHDFKNYYSAHPGRDFAANVWTHNALIAAGSLALGVLLGVPTLLLLWANDVNVGISAGAMAGSGKLGEFFGLILPHGMLELTAVFIAAGVGLRLGWTVIEPGHRSRADALAQEGRAGVAIAIGLTGVLMVSGAIEAFVTPSGLPTWARIGIGALVEIAFLAYVFVLGHRAVAQGETGDVEQWLRAETRATAG